MTEYASRSARKGAEIWHLIRATDRHPSTGSDYENWFVKGPPGLYGPYGQEQALRCFSEKVGVPNAMPPVWDVKPVEPIGPWAPDNGECGRK